MKVTYPRRRAVWTAMLVLVAVALLSMGPVAALARPDEFGGASFSAVYAPYTAGPVVNEEPYAPYTAGPVVREETRPYAPYTAGPVVHGSDVPYAPYTAGPVVRETKPYAPFTAVPNADTERYGRNYLVR